MNKNSETLKRIIEKAADGGFNLENWINDYSGGVWIVDHINGKVGKKLGDYLIESMFLSHPFAKAFWSDFIVCGQCGTEAQDDRNHWYCPECKKWQWEFDFLEEWQYHLQQLVLSENRIRYLEIFISGFNTKVIYGEERR